MKIATSTKPAPRELVYRAVGDDGKLGAVVRTWKYSVLPIDSASVAEHARAAGAKFMTELDEVKPPSIVALTVWRAIALERCVSLVGYGADGQPAAVEVDGEPKGPDDVRAEALRNLDELAVEIGLAARSAGFKVTEERANLGSAPA